MKSASFTGFGRREAAQYQTAGHKQPFFQDIVPQCRAGRIFEQPVQIKFAEIELFGQKIQRQIAGQLLVDKRDDLWDDAFTAARVA